MHPSLTSFSFILFWINLSSLRTSAKTIELTVDNAVALTKALPINKNIAALSIEFCYAVEFLGDVGHPNLLSRQLLQNIEDKLGEPPVIRIGGNTQDRAEFCQSCSSTLYNTFPPNGTESSHTTFNNNLFRVMAENLSPKQKYIFGIDLGLNNVSIPIEQVQAAQRSPAKNLISAYELGNEPDNFGRDKRPNGWNQGIYAKQLVDWYEQIVDANSFDTLPGFQLFSLANEPGSWFTIDGLVALNVTQDIKKNNGTIKSLSDHAYPYSICDPGRAALVSLPGLMNHTSTSQYFSKWQSAIAISHKTVGTKFYMGETGSVSCHGREGVSNTLGAALWQLDYVLYGASIGMDKIFFHQGIPYFYSAWWPSTYNGATPTVWPTYYSFLFMADVVAGIQHTAIYQVTASESLTVYAIYAGTELKRLIVLNLEYWVTGSNSERNCSSIDFSNIFKGYVKIRRLAGSGSDATTNITWAGQSYTTGKANGTIHADYGKLNTQICASEALIIEAAS